jgi:6-phosphogluconolactonase
MQRLEANADSTIALIYIPQQPICRFPQDHMVRLILILLFLMTTALTDARPIPVFFGTNTGGSGASKGIYAAAFDPQGGRFKEEAELVAEIPFPGFLARHPKLPVLYSTSTETVAAFRISEGKRHPVLTPLNVEMTQSERAAHVSVSPCGKTLVTVHYGTGRVVVFPLREDGSIEPSKQFIQLTKASGTNPDRQEAPHPHSAFFDPTGKYLLVPDLGADRTYIHAHDAQSSSLVPHGHAQSAEGAGPRHLKFSPDGQFVYVLNELNQTVDAFAWDGEAGTLQSAGTFAGLTENEKAATDGILASEIRIHPNGKFLYTANRGHNSISVFSIDVSTGQLTRCQNVSAEVNWPRNFNIEASGKWLLCAGQNSSNITVFAIDPESGQLSLSENTKLSVPRPICVEFGN